MFIPFNKMPEEARVWVYQADRKLLPEEIVWLEKVARIFCEQWAAHGNDLVSSFKISFEQFLVLAVDEKTSLPSGCSIDSSVRLINEAQAKLSVNFFDRMKVAFIEEDRVFLEQFQDVKSKIKSGEISRGTTTFNNLVTTIRELEESWQLPAGESWLKKYFA